MSSPINPTTTNARVDAMLTALRAAGLRVTPQRAAICRALVTSRTHPTAQVLYNQLAGEVAGLSRATVYNTLQTLVAGGLIHDLGEAGDGAVHYDADVEPHVNLICLRCHRVDDLPTTALDQVAEQVAGRSGYQLRGARIAYYGLCPECQRAQ